jgi:hypothetical protein
MKDNLPPFAPTGVNAVQWAPSGVALDGVPATMMRLLASREGKTYGYGYGTGWGIVFAHAQGEVEVLPTQWVTRWEDDSITVTDEKPSEAAVFR